MTRLRSSVNFSQAIIAAVLMNNMSNADVVMQRPGADFLVVQGEDFDSLTGTDNFQIVSIDDPITTPFGSLSLPPNSNASGGKAIYDSGPTEHFGQTAEWQLEFMTPGVYSLYFHFSLFEQTDDTSYAAEDSFFLAFDFEDDPEQEGRSNLTDRQGHDDPLEEPPFWEGNFHWQKATWETGQSAEYEVSWNDIGEVLDFRLATSEAGAALDAMVFSLNPSLETRDGFTQSLDVMLRTPPHGVLQAGDADQDLDFDQLDLVKVQIAGKYLTGQVATWGEGDWNGAPGGVPGDPPAGDGLFNQLDIIAALATNQYLTGPFAAGAADLSAVVGSSSAGPFSAVRPDGLHNDKQFSVVYHAATGEIAIDVPTGVELHSINVESEAGIFTGQPARHILGGFDLDSDHVIFHHTFEETFGSLSLDDVAESGLTEDFILNDLTVVSDQEGAGRVDLIYVAVPEPDALMCIAYLAVLTTWHVRIRHASAHENNPESAARKWCTEYSSEVPRHRPERQR